MVLLIFFLKPFKSIFVFILVPLTNPHVSPACRVLTAIPRLLSFATLVVFIETLIGVFWIMTAKTYLCFPTDFESLLHSHLNVSRTPCRKVVNMVIIKIFSVSFSFQRVADSAIFITPWGLIGNETLYKTLFSPT